MVTMETDSRAARPWTFPTAAPAEQFLLMFMVRHGATGQVKQWWDSGGGNVFGDNQHLSVKYVTSLKKSTLQCSIQVEPFQTQIVCKPTSPEASVLTPRLLS